MIKIKMLLKGLVFVCTLISIESASLPLNYEDHLRHNGAEHHSTNNQQLSAEETMYVIKQAQEVIYSGLNSIKDNVDKLPMDGNNVKPNNEDWQKLNETLEEYFRNEYENVIDSTTSKKELLDNITSAFLLYTGNFAENFLKLNNSEQLKQFPKPPAGLPQNIIALFTGGTQQVASDLSTINAGVTTTSKPNFISNIINAYSGGGQKNETTTQPPGSSPPAGPAGFLQGAFGQIVNNFRATTPQATTVKDEATTPVSTTTPRGNPLQNLGNQISNLFKPTTVAVPTSLSTTTEATNFIQNVGQAIQNANPFSRLSTESPPVSTPASGLPFMRNTEMFMCVNLSKMLNRQ